MESFTSAIQTLIQTDKDFPIKMKKRLVLESHNVTNHFKFIVGLFTEGVLDDEADETEASVGLKEMMVQLAMMIVCSKGADAIESFTKALEGSGNSQLISALMTWVKEDFALETVDDNLSAPKGAAAAQTETYQFLPTKQLKSTIESESNAEEWPETSQVRQKNYPISVKTLRDQQKQETSTNLISRFFNQAPPSNALEKVATFSCSPELFTKGKFNLEFGKEKMMACFSNGTVKLWNWRENEENTTKFGSKDKVLTAFQYDEDILVLGTAAGTVHLYDAKKLEEKWSDRIGEPVHSLKLAKSTLVVVTRNGNEDKIWWLEISHSDMRLLNRRPVTTISNKMNYGFLIDYYSYVYYSNVVLIRDSKTGESYPDRRGRACWMEAPAIITAFNVVDLIGAKSVVIAGCQNGVIAIWHTHGASALQHKPVKSFQGHQAEIVGLTAINGHLLSVCEGGKLLMWSGHDLQNLRVTPIPRVLAENFHNVTSLVACERWFASTSSEEGTINIWALPELWLCTD